MAKSSKPKISDKPPNIETLNSDVASFASQLGLGSAPTSTTSGFNDSSFRKNGTVKPPKPTQIPPNKANSKNLNDNNNNNNNNNNVKPKPKPNAALQAVSAEVFNPKVFDKFKNLPKLPLVKASSLGVWYDDLAELERVVIGEGKRVDVKNGPQWKELVEKKRELGERLLAQYSMDYDKSEGNKGDIKMLVSTQRSGTAADKVSAYTVLIQENPLANMRSLDAILALVTSKVGKRHAFTGFDALKELFISRLLPDRKLKNLLQRPVDQLPESKDGNSLLLFWYWEECLKLRYERFIGALEDGSRDILPLLKDKALKTIYTLLRSKSEQERRLLSALVNKLGDPQNKGASNADYHLSNLLADHPNMKAVVIDEVDSFLFRPHLGLRSKYHAVNFLSQIRLSHKGDGPRVAKRLIDVYFALFKVLISEASGGQKRDKKSKAGDKKTKAGDKKTNAGDKKTKAVGEESNETSLSDPQLGMDSRLLSVLLTGVNRAFPFVASSDADDIIDVETPMLFKLVHSENFNVGIQALMLLDKLSAKNQIVSDRFYRALYSKLLLPAAMNTSKAEMFIGLLLRTMKSDVNLKRVSAFAKRLLQVALQQPPQYACGCLFLLSELLKARPPLWSMVIQSESNDDELEHFEDIVEESESERSIKSKKINRNGNLVRDSDNLDLDNDSSQDEDDASVKNKSKDLPNAKTNPEFAESQSQASNLESSLPGGYNPRGREPSFCNADRVSWWELKILSSHVHPSVATMAGTLLSGANIVYNGNPLNDLSLAAFLDKFMEKKPKATTWHGASQIEPDKQMDMNHQLIGPEILSLPEVDVPPEDLVFHRFYANKTTSKKKQKKKKKGAEDDAVEEIFDVGSGGDDSDDEEIDKMLDSTEAGSDGEYDYDDLDNIANEDDDDLVDDGSDEEMEFPSDTDITEGDAVDDTASGDFSDDESDVEINIGDVDDPSSEEDEPSQKKRKRKPITKKGASPFASLEEYEHLMDDQGGDSPAEEEPTKKKHKSEKKKKNRKKKNISK